jgi:hypothetical protein
MLPSTLKSNHTPVIFRPIQVRPRYLELKTILKPIYLKPISIKRPTNYLNTLKYKPLKKSLNNTDTDSLSEAICFNTLNQPLKKTLDNTNTNTSVFEGICFIILEVTLLYYLFEIIYIR